MNVGRNDPCPCGSGKKYKKCHLSSGQGMSMQSKLIISLLGVILLVGFVLLISSVRNFEGGGGTRVWSEEHQHWHNL